MTHNSYTFSFLTAAASVEINSEGLRRLPAPCGLARWAVAPSLSSPLCLLFTTESPTSTQRSQGLDGVLQTERLRAALQRNSSIIQLSAPQPPPPLILHLSIIKNEHLTVSTAGARKKQEKQKKRRPGSTEWALCVFHLLDSGQRVGQFSSNMQRAGAGACSLSQASGQAAGDHPLSYDCAHPLLHLHFLFVFVSVSSSQNKLHFLFKKQSLCWNFVLREEWKIKDLRSPFVFGCTRLSGRTHAEQLHSPAKSPK